MFIHKASHYLHPRKNFIKFKKKISLCEISSTFFIYYRSILANFDSFTTKLCKIFYKKYFFDFYNKIRLFKKLKKKRDVKMAEKPNEKFDARLGETFQAFRLSKDISSDEACKGVCTRKTLWNLFYQT
jgi:hypothetical protein